MEDIVPIISKYGLGLVVFAYFMYMFTQQNKLMAKERDELKNRIVKLEADVNKNQKFIQDELMTVIKDNSKAFIEVTATIREQTVSYRDLCDKIGKIGKA